MINNGRILKFTENTFVEYVGYTDVVHMRYPWGLLLPCQTQSLIIYEFGARVVMFITNVVLTT